MTSLPGAPESAGTRRALIIANDTYEHASLTQLRAPEADARALAEVLGDSDIGGFDVSVVRNAASYEVQAHIDDLFADSRPEDLLLLHFSGHGLKSDTGELFFAARNTRPDRLGSTSVSADFVQRCMRSARARTIVLFIDCCYGGAFGEGVAVRAGGPVNVADSFPAGRLGGGRGRAVISASSAMEYAFEGTTLTADHQPQPSVFTSALVEGLRSGEADRDEDGLVALGELYDYVFDRVREQNPRQTPGRDVEMSGEVYLARSRRRRTRPVPISEALRTALGNPDPTYRRGAVLELRDRLAHEDLGVALGALEALREVARSDTRSVADDAVAVIDAAAPKVTPAALDFGDLHPDADVAVERELHVHGLPIAREVRAEADPPLSAVVEGGTVTVSLSPPGRAFAGTVTLIGSTGSVIVPVEARVTSRWASPPTEVPAPTPPEPVGEAAGSATAASGPELTERRLTPAEPAAQPHITPSPTPVERPLEDTKEALGTAGDTAYRRIGAGSARESSEEERRLGRWPAWGLFIGAGMVLAGTTWWFAEQDATVTFEILLGPGVRALLAVVAAALVLAPRVRADVAIGFLTGCVAAAGMGVLTSIGVAVESRIENRDIVVGWVLAFVGQSLITITGLAVVAVTAWRSPLPRGPIAWRDGATYAVLATAAVTAVVLANYAGYVGSVDIPIAGYWAAILYLWGLLTVALTLLALSARPSAAGRMMLLAWAIAVLGLVLSEWVLLTAEGGDASGMPWLVTTTALLAIGGGFIGRRAAPA
jgi:hypothetical protein